MVYRSARASGNHADSIKQDMGKEGKEKGAAYGCALIC